MTDGDGVSNNTVAITNFALGGGMAGPGGPNITGGASGNLSGTVTLTDTNFLNELDQQFVPGNPLQFDVQMTTNFAGGTPDQFSFAILDNTLTEIPTFSPPGTPDVFLFVDGDSANPPIQTFAGDPNRPGGINISAPQVQIIPEPAAFVLLIMGLGGWAVSRWWTKR